MRFSKACAALFLALLLALLSAPFSAPAGAVADPSVTIGVLSDPHFYPEDKTGGCCEAFQKDNRSDGWPVAHAEGVLVAALASLEARVPKGMKYLLVPGDLTRDGELFSHERIAGYLLAFEDRTGVEVAVIPGNHDINRGANAKDYSGGAARQTDAVTPEKFKEIYADLGYDLADSAPPAGEEGWLSYAADLGGFRLLALDTRAVRIGDAQMAWLLDELGKAKTPVIGMGHHNLTEHIGLEESLFKTYVLDDYREVREILADAGMHFYISGHIHVEEIGEALSDKGEVLYDISCSSLATYPYTLKEITFSAAGDTVTADVRSFPADEAGPVTAGGTTYPQPYAKTGFAVSYWAANGETPGLCEFAAYNIASMLRGPLESIAAAGGVNAYLKASGTDIGKTLHNALGGGLSVGDWNVFSEKNIMGLVEDLLAQVDALYINNPARLEALIGRVFGKVFGYQVSKLPCTAFLGSLGFGDAKKPGTFEDFANSTLAYIYGHPGDYTKDAFFMDVVRKAQSGALLDELLGLVTELLIDDVIGGELLSALKLNAKSVFANQLSKDTVGCLLNVLLDAKRGTVSHSRVAGLLRKLGYKGLAFAVRPVVSLVLPADLLASLNATLNLMVNEMILVRKPTGDRDAVLVYDGPRNVEIGANRDYRTPFDITAVRGTDKTSAVVTWYTKRSVIASDIQISQGIEAGGLRQPFAAGLTVTIRTEECTRLVNALDLGVAVLMGEELKVTRHIVTVEGLDPGKEYYACAGDAARGWLSAPLRLGEGSEPGFWQKLGAFFTEAWAWIVRLLRNLLYGIDAIRLYVL
ncbi:MAG: metallophosphoesterase [Firmicutes bacterium]|nr:metallophosphoesterase [Bacillota bacterium]